MGLVHPIFKDRFGAHLVQNHQHLQGEIPTMVDLVLQKSRPICLRAKLFLKTAEEERFQKPSTKPENGGFQ